MSHIVNQNKTGEKILDVKNLRISFKTNGGTVKAVRGIDFSLYRGRTLAIVGESGSGKSVTSKAILGILANNKIIEDGQIIFEGEDLLKLKEDRLSKIRGVKISMIFQDPLSSLNPIMIVGKQLTEAMVLKRKAASKEGRKNISRLNKALSKGEKSVYESLIAFVKGYKDGDPINESSYSEFFVAASKEAILKRKEEASKAIEVLDSTLKDAAFLKKESFDMALARKKAKELKPVINKCLLETRTKSDDTIEVFSTIIDDIYHSYKDAKKHLEIRDKTLAKYNVTSFFDLPAAKRAKMREVVKPLTDFEDAMNEAIASLRAHLVELKDEPLSDAAGEGEVLTKAYFDYLRDYKRVLSASEAKEKAIKLLGEVGIDEPERRYKQYPFELSGGMRQRIVIAIALSSSPDVLICDEPTTALDVTIQSQILELINKLKEEKNLSIIFITHDLGVVANMADDIAVMYAGKIVEFGTATDVFYDPRHPYTWALLGSMPDLSTKEKLNAIPGTPPNMLLPPKGDAFASRNHYALKLDYEEQPPFFAVSPTHYAATWCLASEAPDVKVPEIVSMRIYNALKSHPEYTPVPTNKKNSVLNYIGEKK